MLRVLVERPQPGQARVCLIGPDGNIVQEHLETNPTKADAMTNALESQGELGVVRGTGA